jgi:hypothetical protein
MYGGGRVERCIQGFGGETEGMKTLGRSRCRWGDNNEMDLKPIGTASTGLI